VLRKDERQGNGLRAGKASGRVVFNCSGEAFARRAAKHEPPFVLALRRPEDQEVYL
jgi:hypothetical protein